MIQHQWHGCAISGVAALRDRYGVRDGERQARDRGMAGATIARASAWVLGACACGARCRARSHQRRGRLRTIGRRAR
jgi:hypothetical protein